MFRKRCLSRWCVAKQDSCDENDQCWQLPSTALIAEIAQIYNIFVVGVLMPLFVQLLEKAFVYFAFFVR